MSELAADCNSTSDVGSASPCQAIIGGKKIPKERKRIGRACDHCKGKKIKCTGSLPCQQCVINQFTCTFNTPYARGRRKISSDPAINHHIVTATPVSREDVALAPSTKTNSPIVPQDTHSQPFAGSFPEYQNVTVEHSLRASPEAGESDRQGHFVGASSGFAFLLRLQKRLRSTGDGISAPTSIFTLGDATLPVFDELSFMLPSRSEAHSLIATYFDIASPTYRYFHRGTVEQWLEELYGDGKLKSSSHAALLIVFAQATRYMSSDLTSKGTSANSGILYFQAAERQLNRETEPVSLTTVQALLGSCFYTLTCSRLNHCWSLFGTTSRLIIALGLHRKSAKFDVIRNTSINYIESECRKRVFWSAYNLDKYLSAILGRPSVFHDEDIDQVLPTLVDDNYLTKDSINIDAHGKHCAVLGLVMHVKIVQIISRTLRLLYGVKPIGEAEKQRVMRELGDEVTAWREQLPPYLNPDLVDSRLLLPLFQRQNNLLSLAYAHAEILIYRPSLFKDPSGNEQPADAVSLANVKSCVHAAILIVNVIERMVEVGQFYAGSWFAQYQAFCATVVLYTYTTRLVSESGTAWKEYFDSAQRCQSYVAISASPDSLAYRFHVIMEEYRLEVLRQIRYWCISSHGIEAEGFTRQQTTELPREAVSIEESSLWQYNDPCEQDSISALIDLPNWDQLYPIALDLNEGLLSNY